MLRGQANEFYELSVLNSAANPGKQYLFSFLSLSR